MAGKYEHDPNTSVTFTSLDKMVDFAINWCRKSSFFYLLFGLACCGIELMQTGGPRADIDRFGAVLRVIFW